MGKGYLTLERKNVEATFLTLATSFARERPDWIIHEITSEEQAYPVTANGSVP
jgi:hypothetical protein